MKTFEDLEFKDHPINPFYGGSKYAQEKFDNGYGVSVVFGIMFYSNGIDTYELAVLFNNEISYNTNITDDVMGYLSKDEVTDIMRRVQEL